MARDVSLERERALNAALDLYNDGLFASLSVNSDEGPAYAAGAFLDTAESIFRWLSGGVSFTITHGVVVDQTTGQPTGTITGGTAMQLRDNEQVDLTVTVASAKGNVIGDDPSTNADDLVWTAEGGEGVIELEVSEDTRTATVVAQDTGSAVVRVELSGTDLFATVAVDVVPGEAALVTIAEGTPTKQPEPEPEPEPTPEP
jgi:hypothetical protein